MDAVAFKKKAKKSVAGRKRERADDDDLPEREEETHQTIEELLEDQRLRATLLRAEQRKQPPNAKGGGAATPAAAASDTQYGLHDPKKDGAAGQKLLNLLDGQFTGQSGVTQRDQYEELANRYIEERLQKQVNTDADDAQETPVLTDEDALYAELRNEVNGSTQASAESANGGVLVWNTGIAEVELPSSYHDKTVLETKKALERESAAARRTINSSALPANFSTDFNRHKSDFIAELKALPREEQRDRGFIAAPKKHKPSDDQAVSRFRKMESRRRHNK